MATHCSILVLRIPWAEECGGLPSIGSQRVRYKCVTYHAHTHTHTYTYAHIYTYTHTAKMKHE